MEITLDVYWRQYDWQENGRFHIETSNDDMREHYSKSTDQMFIKTIEVDILNVLEPTHEQVVKAKIAALQSERKAIMAESQIKLNYIDDKIKQLSCITYVAE